MSADQIPLLSFRNRRGIEHAKCCGCYQCLEVFPVSAVKDWTDDNQTALCPHCECDTLIADNAGIELTRENLRSIRKNWFGKDSNEGQHSQGST